MILSASLARATEREPAVRPRIPPTGSRKPGRGLPAQKGIKLSWLWRMEDGIAKPSLLTTITPVCRADSACSKAQNHLLLDPRAFVLSHAA